MWAMILMVILAPVSDFIEFTNPVNPNSPYVANLITRDNGVDWNVLRLQVTGFQSAAECACFLTNPNLGCGSPLVLNQTLGGAQFTVTSWRCVKVS